MNCNLQVCTSMFWDALEPHGINNRNITGKDLLYLLKSNNLPYVLTYFEHVNYVTYRTFNAAKLPHMLDNFICCNKFSKEIPKLMMYLMISYTLP